MSGFTRLNWDGTNLYGLIGVHTPLLGCYHSPIRLFVPWIAKYHPFPLIVCHPRRQPRPTRCRDVLRILCSCLNDLIPQPLSGCKWWEKSPQSWNLLIRIPVSFFFPLFYLCLAIIRISLLNWMSLSYSAGINFWCHFGCTGANDLRPVNEFGQYKRLLSVQSTPPHRTNNKMSSILL